MITTKDDNVLIARVHAGFNQSELARKAKVAPVLIGRVERGVGISPKTAKAICEALNADFDALFLIKQRDDKPRVPA